MTFTFWKGQVLSNSHLRPLAFVIPIVTHLTGLVSGASVNMIETPRMCGHGVTTSEDRPVIQQRGEKCTFHPK